MYTIQYKSGGLMVMNSSARGHFVKTMYWDCTNSPRCTLINAILFRPDYAHTGFAARSTVYKSMDGSCDDEQVTADKITNVYSVFDKWFENSEPAVFHGVNCNKFYNDTDFVAYANESDVLGYEKRQMETTITVIPHEHVAKDFAFDSNLVPRCSIDAYWGPNPGPFSKACDDIPQY